MYKVHFLFFYDGTHTQLTTTTTLIAVLTCLVLQWKPLKKCLHCIINYLDDILQNFAATSCAAVFSIVSIELQATFILSL